MSNIITKRMQFELCHILFAKYFIYDCKKNDKPVDFYNFQVKLKTRMVIEYRSELYNRKLDFLVKWSVLSDSF